MVNPWKTNVKLSAVLMGSHGRPKGSLAFLNYLAQIMFKSTKYTEAKQSFTEVCDCASSVNKSHESGEDFFEGRKTSLHRGSTGSDLSDESSASGFSNVVYKPHQANDVRWEAIQAVRSRHGMLELKHFRMLMQLGSGDISTVYLAELSGTITYFTIKVMNKARLEIKKQLLRAQMEREIFHHLDHPFLPTLYNHFETDTSAFLVMEFFLGGDLHVLIQRQPGRCFSEQATRYDMLSNSFISLLFMIVAYLVIILVLV